MVTRSLTILNPLDLWINSFRAKMLEQQNQSVSYTAALNLIGRMGALILSEPGKLTDEQKQIIHDYIDESNQYAPPYARIEWSDKYLSLMVPRILDGSANSPYELSESRKELMYSLKK